MKKLYSKPFGIFVVLLTIISVLASASLTAFANVEDAYKYHIEEDGLYISSLNEVDSSLTGLSIPREMSENTVVGIDDNAFFDTNLEWISIPETITVLGDNIVDTTKCAIQYQGSREQWVGITNSSSYNKYVTCMDGKIFPAASAVTKLTTSYLNMTISFKPAQADGYQIQYSVYSDFKSAKSVYLSAAATSKKISSLSAKKYYVRIRTYNKLAGKNYYSAWSDAKSVTVKGESLALSATSAVTYPKKTYTIKATTNPAGKKVTWTSSNKKVATVDKNGKVTGIKTGTTTITCKYVYNKKTIKKTCKITVKNPAINKTSATIYNSKTLQLAVNGALSKVTWSSSNKKVATVSSKGVVTGLKAGKCTITAKCGNKTYKCTVTVSKRIAEYKDCVDFGAITGIKRARTKALDGGLLIAYSDASVSKVSDDAISKYVQELYNAGFSYVDSYEDDYGYPAILFANGKTAIEMSADDTYLYILCFKY